MAITDEQKYLLNNQMGHVAHKVQLGTLIEAAEEGGLADDAVTTAKIEDEAVTTAKLDGDAVDGTKIADAAVSVEHLDSGIAPSHVVKYAGKFTTLGGDATEVITVTGLEATDVVIVQVETTGTGNRTIVDAIPTTNTITVTLSGDPTTDHILSYMALRAAV